MAQTMALYCVFIITLCAGITISQQATLGEPIQMQATKIFTYKGEIPIKPDDTVSISDQKPNSETVTQKPVTPSANTTEDPEDKCWNAINQLTKVTFDQQRTALSDMETELEVLNVEPQFLQKVRNIGNQMRNNMDEATKALEDEKPEKYFDALFDTSENIMKFSTMLRDPKINDDVFFVVVKSLSRLGRNNAILVQELTTSCTAQNIIRRGPALVD